jgi:uncharacterized protein YprB with RNaseH-like and TPR domain
MDGAKSMLLQALARRLQALDRRAVHYAQPVEDVLPGSAVFFGPAVCYVYDSVCRDLGGAVGEGIARRLHCWHAARAGADAAQALLSANLERVVFLDLETTGFGGPLFLVGALRCLSGQLRIRQFLARDYAEEEGVLTAAASDLSSAELVITYNGRSFDLPYLQERSLSLGLGRLTLPPDLDLLPLARQRWRERLPNCRLQTLERQLCGRLRFDDIRGSDIPATYHAFVRDGNARRLAPILRHNRLDLATMAELIPRLLD